MSDTKNWKELFVEKHARLDYGPEEIQELYLIVERHIGVRA